MKNFILRDENAIYYECKFSCDNVIYLNLGDEKYFITDANEIHNIPKENINKTYKELLEKI